MRRDTLGNSDGNMMSSSFGNFDRNLRAAARRLLIGLMLVEVGLVVINLAHYATGFPLKIVHRWFYLDGENGFAAWFSAAQILLIGVCFLMLGLLADRRLRLNRFFLLLAGGFVFLSMDESIAFHENASTILMHNLLGQKPGDALGIAVIAYPVAALILAAFNWRSIVVCLQRFRGPSLWLGAGTAIYILGAAGIEVVSYDFAARDPANLLYLVQVSAEEFLEMVGCTVILLGSLALLVSVPLRDLRTTPPLQASVLMPTDKVSVSLEQRFPHNTPATDPALILRLRDVLGLNKRSSTRELS